VIIYIDIRGATKKMVIRIHVMSDKNIFSIPF